MKQCRKCGETKIDSSFYRDKNVKDGLRSWCKICIKIDNKKYYKKWYEKSGRDYGIKYRHTHAPEGYVPRGERKKLDNMGFSLATICRYGRETLKKLKDTREWNCSICGSEDDLTLHHIDHNGINFWKKKQYDKINNSIENLEILCRSCHGGYHSRLKYKNLLNKKVNNL